MLNIVDKFFIKSYNRANKKLFNNIMKKLFVDANLNLVKDERKAKAIVNYLSDTRVQIMFLDPIAFYADVKGAVLECRKWVEKHYPRYYNAGRVVLPTPEICMIANRNSDMHLITSCHTSKYVIDNDKKFRYRVYINNYGLPDYGSGRVKQKNVYATLALYKSRFEKLNPQLDWGDYQLKMPEPNPEF